MLPSQHRLQKDADFKRVYRKGKSLNTPVLRIQTIANSLPHTRFGVVIPNKVLKLATDRSAKKRQVRAALAELLEKVIPGYDIVVAGKKGILEANYTQLLKELDEGFTKIGFLK
jgi:ribonuclease P protein component